mmetsp:Transcript_21028/g.59733  ORF Transcript_21028/g.59733 Transcript_21028/m.59733 type:complete len:226 (-) Transcript_21028:1956-2633(-)
MQTGACRIAIWSGPAPAEGPPRCTDSHALSAQARHTARRPRPVAAPWQRWPPGLWPSSSAPVKRVPSTLAAAGAARPARAPASRRKRLTLAVSTSHTGSPAEVPPRPGPTPARAAAAAQSPSPTAVHRRTTSFPGLAASSSWSTRSPPLVPKTAGLGTTNSKTSGSGGSGIASEVPDAGTTRPERYSTRSAWFCVNQCSVPSSSTSLTADLSRDVESTSRAWYRG